MSRTPPTPGAFVWTPGEIMQDTLAAATLLLGIVALVLSYRGWIKSLFDRWVMIMGELVTNPIKQTYYLCN
jgi:hypothetical protein